MDTLNRILSGIEEAQNEILDKIVKEENSENLVALQLNLARGIVEIKLLATQPSKPRQLYPQNAILYDNNQPIIFLFQATRKAANKRKSAIYIAWNVSHQLNTGEICCIPPKGDKSAYIIGLIIILSQLEQIKQQRAALITSTQPY